MPKLSPIEQGFREAIAKDPKDKAPHAVYADWLEQEGREVEALKERAKAGQLDIRWRLRNKQTGEFVPKVEYRRKCDLSNHLLHCLHRNGPRSFNYTTRQYEYPEGEDWYYRGTPASDLEIVSVVMRPQILERFEVTL